MSANHDTHVEAPEIVIFEGILALHDETMRSLFDRSKEQLYYALADAILLSRAPRLLGSTWSSFSELAMRLAPQKMVVEMSGTDF